MGTFLPKVGKVGMALKVEIDSKIPCQDENWRLGKRSFLIHSFNSDAYTNRRLTYFYRNQNLLWNLLILAKKNISHRKIFRELLIQSNLSKSTLNPKLLPSIAITPITFDETSIFWIFKFRNAHPYWGMHNHIRKMF